MYLQGKGEVDFAVLKVLTGPVNRIGMEGTGACFRYTNICCGKQTEGNPADAYLPRNFIWLVNTQYIPDDE